MSFLQLNHPNYVLIVGGKNARRAGFFASASGCGVDLT